MNPPAYAACSLGVPAIRRDVVDFSPKGEVFSGALATRALAVGALAVGVLGAVAAGAVALGVVDSLGVVVSLGVGVADALSLADGVGVAVAVEEVVGLGAGVTSARATDGIPKVSAASANGAATRTRSAERSMWGTAFLGGS